MWQWGAPEHLQLLLLVLGTFVVALWYARRIRRRLYKLWGPKALSLVMPGKSQKTTKLFLQSCVLVLMVLALARPQRAAQEKSDTSKKGIQMLFVVDVSKSMLVQDVWPSRLRAAKSFLEKLVQARAQGGTQDSIGVVAFAGDAQLVSPLTTDVSSTLMQLNALDTNTISSQGTSIGRALSVAAKALERGGLDEGTASAPAKAVVIVSDGEEHKAFNEKQARALSQKGVRIFSVAVGTAAGGPIKQSALNAVAAIGDGSQEFLRDANNKVVISRVQLKGLKKLARLGRGNMYNIKKLGQDVQRRLSAQLARLEQGVLPGTRYTNFSEYFGWFLCVAWILALLELLWAEKKPSTPHRA